MTLARRIFCALAFAWPIGAVADPPAPISLEELNVGAVVEASALLRHAGELPAAEAITFRAAHEGEMVRAYNILNMAAVARETVLHVNEAAAAQYHIQLVCNYDDERKPSVEALAGEFVLDERAKFGLADADEARRKLYLVNWDEMLARTMLRHYACASTGAASVTDSSGSPRP